MVKYKKNMNANKFVMKLKSAKFIYLHFLNIYQVEDTHKFVIKLKSADTYKFIINLKMHIHTSL